MKRLFYGFLFVFLTILPLTGLFAQQKYALVIGNGTYTGSGMGKLANPVNDANDVAAALQGLGFTVDKVLDASLEQMESSIMRLKNRLSVSNEAYGFFFYAGHGVQSGGENYLIPVGANIPSENSLRDRAVSVQWALAELNDAKNALNVVVLDACRDNPFSWKRSGTRGLSVVANQPADSIIVYATSAGSTAADGTGRNGLFTTHLLTNLKTPGIEVKEIFNRTGADVSRASNRQQIPAVYNQFFDTAYLGSKPVAGQAQKSNDIFTGEDKNGSLSIYNQASFDVVIFAGQVTRNIVMGGIKAGESRIFDLAKLPLPAKNGSFLIRAVSYDTYSRKNSKVSEEDVLCKRLVVYNFNYNIEKINLYIYAGIDQSQRYRFTVSNASKFILELRENNPNGIIITTLAPLERNKQVFLTPTPNGMPYVIYAVYMFVDPNTNELKTFVSKADFNQLRIAPKTYEMDFLTFSGPKDNSDISYLVGFLRIRNETSENIIFKNGMTGLRDQKGLFSVQAGSDATFELEAMDAGRTYPALSIQFDSTKTLEIASLSIRPGIVYDLTVTTRNGNPVYDIRETGLKDRLDDMRINLLFE